MKCPYHITKDVTGYCSVCGSFVCDICLGTHEGVSYCPKHFKAIASKLGQSEQAAMGRRRQSRNRLIVQNLNGSKLQGASRSMNLRDAGFYLECEDNNGVSTNESVRVQFVDVKYVAHVKSYDGKFDHNEKFQQYDAGGTHVVVRFKDGEVQEGITVHGYVPGNTRFYMIPGDPNSNFINILVEASAVERVYTPDEYRALMVQEKELRKQRKADLSVSRQSVDLGNHDSDGALSDAAAEADSSTLTQEESMGDFYFETHNYTGALDEYEVARKIHPDSPRLQRKCVVATINIGIQHIKSREYPRALEYMEAALKIDPKNPHARKKAKQLKKIIKKTERRMREYYEQQAQGPDDGGL